MKITTSIPITVFVTKTDCGTEGTWCYFETDFEDGRKCFLFDTALKLNPNSTIPNEGYFRCKKCLSLFIAK
jgi:hypothetical protein